MASHQSSSIDRSGRGRPGPRAGAGTVDFVDGMDRVDAAGLTSRPRRPLCPARPLRPPAAAGFSLIEVLIATLLVGLSIAALVTASGSFSLANVAGADLSTAEFLVEQIRELTMMLPVADPDAATWTVLGLETGETTLAAHDDVDDFDGFDSTSLGAPINARGELLNDLAAFRQQVIVQKVDPSNFDQAWSDNSTSNFARVTVSILQNGRSISSTSWIRARY